MIANDAELSNRPFINIPPSTIHNQAKACMKELENSKTPSTPPHRLNSGSNEVMQPSKSIRSFIAHTIKFRDKAQNGKSRTEIIQFIMKLTGATDKVPENHFDWMIHKMYLPELKNNGRVQKAQAMPASMLNNSSAGTMQLRLFGKSIIYSINQQLNSPPSRCISSWTWMASITACNLKIVGLAAVKKHFELAQQ